MGLKKFTTQNEHIFTSHYVNYSLFYGIDNARKKTKKWHTKWSANFAFLFNEGTTIIVAISIGQLLIYDDFNSLAERHRVFVNYCTFPDFLLYYYHYEFILLLLFIYLLFYILGFFVYKYMANLLSSSSLSLLKICQICGDTGDAVHFGAMACRACAGMF